MTKDPLKYRPDIDGLRAIAVLAVVAYHWSPRLVPGGYIGVDIFFVISGYLITRIINAEIQERRFSIWGFYERRIRRIFPALFTLLIAVLVVGYFLSLPSDYVAISRAAFGTVIFSSNVVFMRGMGLGYFARMFPENPLLHTWSLGVEEQFYLCYPLLLLACFRFARQYTRRILLCVACLSLFLAAKLLPEHGAAVFFLIPFRAWELLVGAVVALGPGAQWKSLALKEIAALSGLIAIAAPVYLYDSHTAFPGLAALPPVLGTAILIHVGSADSRLTGGVLHWRPLVYLGLISYSLYLWHWPLFVFAKLWLSADALRLWKLPLLIVAIACASISYHFIEKPYRKRGNGVARTRVFAVAAGVAAMLATYSLLGVVKRGFEGRFDHQVVSYDRLRAAPVLYIACEARIGNPGDRLCLVGDRTRPPNILLWGDSHALAWMPAFDVALRQVGRSALASPDAACPPILDLAIPLHDTCHEENAAVFKYLQGHPEIDTVVMAGFWFRYFQEGPMSLVSPSAGKGNSEIVPPAFRKTISRLTGLGEHVIVLGPVPFYSKDVPFILAQAEILRLDHYETQDLGQVHRMNDSFYRTAATISTDRFRFVDVAAWLCKPTCETARRGVSLYRDSNHLSASGAVAFAPDIARIFESDGGPNDMAPGNPK